MYKNTFAFTESFLPHHICDQIKNLGYSLQNVDGTISEEGIAKKTRDSRVAWINNHFWIKNWIIPLAYQINKDMEWNFPLDEKNMEQFQFTRYKTNQFYGWHIDSSLYTEDEVSKRMLSLSITLSSPEEYKGGNLEFYEYKHPNTKEEDKILTDSRIKQKGTITFFPSNIYHRVTKVEEGERCSLVLWIPGDKNTNGK